MAKHTVFFGFAAMIALSLSTACSGSGDSAPSRDLALVRACTGEYRCVFTALEQTLPAADSVQVELTASSGVCGAAELFTLYMDGSAVFDPSLQQPPSTWSGDRNQFKTCFQDSQLGCIECYAQGPTSASAPGTSTSPGASGHCTGEADDCESCGSTCHGQAGCYVEVGIGPYSSDHCIGHATACADISTKDSCDGQHGCSWQ